MDKDLLIKLQKEKSHKMLKDANDMVEQKRWDIILLPTDSTMHVITCCKDFSFLVASLRKVMMVR